MGQSQSNPQPARLGVPQSTLRRSLKKVYSEQKVNPRSSRSLPSSPATHKRRMDPTPSSPKTQWTFEAIFKNFGELTQNQWPTWAKRRGWIAEFPDISVEAAEGSGRVVQLDKETWIFQKSKQQTETDNSMNSGHDRLVEGSETDKAPVSDIVELGHFDENKPGQRSRRSSGYASASNSPLTKRLTDKITVPDEDLGWRRSLYEVTLRWIFDFDASEHSDMENLPNSVDKHCEVDNSGSNLQKETAEVSQETMGNYSETLIRIYINLFRRYQVPLPPYIDFQQIQIRDQVDHVMYRPILSNHMDEINLLPRNCRCNDLIREIVTYLPAMKFEVDRMALYEKTWRPGKTSRAQLRRLADLDHPFLVIQPEKEGTTYIKTLVLQESQNGDIPWEDFTVAELSSFLRVLDREEANHELQIREKYQRLNHCLKESMQRFQLSNRQLDTSSS